MNLLKDSAQLQTQLRLYENLVDTRHSILRLRPNQRQNWVALAVAHDLNGNPREARMVLEHYQRSLKVSASCPSAFFTCIDNVFSVRMFPTTMLNTLKHCCIMFTYLRKSEISRKPSLC